MKTIRKTVRKTYTAPCMEPVEIKLCGMLAASDPKEVKDDDIEFEEWS